MDKKDMDDIRGVNKAEMTQVMMDEMNEMLMTLSLEGYISFFGVLGTRTTYCWIKSYKDGWENVGLAYTKNTDNFDYLVGRYWALKEAYGKREDRTEN